MNHIPFHSEEQKDRSSSSPELDIHRQFEVFMQRSLRGIMGSMKQDGLSMPQIYTLMYLYHEGEVRISDIGVLMDVGKAAASQLVERLVQQGLVERVEDESDRRAKKIRLLPKSLRLIEKGLAAQRQLMGELMGQLSPEQMATVQKAFMYLIEAMHKGGAHERNKPEMHGDERFKV
jgi:DNA-binding MarR family transcriptional regulator